MKPYEQGITKKALEKISNAFFNSSIYSYIRGNLRNIVAVSGKETRSP